VRVLPGPMFCIILDERDMREKKSHYSCAFTMIEVLIVVMFLAILAMIVVPKVMDAGDDARESALLTDIQTVRRQIMLYTLEHNGRGPHLNHKDKKKYNQLVRRMTERTDIDGKFNENGAYGPYLYEWPSNPFVDSSVAQDIQFGTKTQPPRNDRTGWYCNKNTLLVSANSKTGGEALDPE